MELLVSGLTAEAEAIMRNSAEEAMNQIKAAYPARPGPPADGVMTDRPAGPRSLAPGVPLLNKATDAHLFETAPQARHTSLGAFRGSMPPGHVFVPIAEERRREAIEQIKQRLLDHGAASVHGEADLGVK